jgi:hypothetical protein
MTSLKTLGAVVVLSAAVATPAFAHSTHHLRHHYRDFRGSYNQIIGPSYYAVPSLRGERNLENFEFNRSFPGGEDPSNNPPS